MKKVRNLLCFSIVAVFVLPVVSVAEPQTLIPMGNAIGIQIRADGVLVVGLSPVAAGGAKSTPALDAGLKVGDTLTHIDGQAIAGSQPFYEAVQRTAGQRMTLQGLRDGKAYSVELQAVQADVDDKFRIGVFVRDHMAGIGTVTYYDPQAQQFGALGHGIHDGDSDKLMPMSQGSVTHADIVDVKRGTAGEPGELHGSFDLADVKGVLLANTESGIFGQMKPSLAQCHNKALPVAQPSQVKEGKAQIYSQVSGGAVNCYDIEILRLLDKREVRNMIIRITDKRLLAATGGIVQGMSGSPIVQDGKLVGAVTHVFVSDPQRGYGIFVTNMLSAAQRAAPAQPTQRAA